MRKSVRNSRLHACREQRRATNNTHSKTEHVDTHVQVFLQLHTHMQLHIDIRMQRMLANFQKKDSPLRGRDIHLGQTSGPNEHLRSCIHLDLCCHSCVHSFDGSLARSSFCVRVWFFGFSFIWLCTCAFVNVIIDTLCHGSFALSVVAFGTAAGGRGRLGDVKGREGRVGEVRRAGGAKGCKPNLWKKQAAFPLCQRQRCKGAFHNNYNKKQNN